MAATQTQTIDMATGTPLVARAYRWPHAPHGAAREPELASTLTRPARDIEVRELTAKDVMPAARLLALRHRQARETAPGLSAAYQSARPWFIELARGFERKHGVVATADGEIVGFMIAEPGSSHPIVTQSAVVPGADARRIYSEMCGAISGRS